MTQIHLPEYTVSDSSSIFEAFSYSSTVDILDTGKQQIRRRFSIDIFQIDMLLVVFDIGNNHKGQCLGHACVCVCVYVCVEGLKPSPIPKTQPKCMPNALVPYMGI